MIYLHPSHLFKEKKNKKKLKYCSKSEFTQYCQYKYILKNISDSRGPAGPGQRAGWTRPPLVTFLAFSDPLLQSFYGYVKPPFSDENIYLIF